MSAISTLLEFILHIDVHLAAIIAQYGTSTYVLMFLIIFAETGIVFTPFLPGDSLLFTLGAFAAQGILNLPLLLILLSVAAILGDTANYWIGSYLGKKIIAKNWIKQKHIEKTEQFYHKHGKKTIILARFIPIVRTFAPFMAGVGKMNYSTFLLNNIIGGILWVCAFTLIGYFFGNFQFVQDHFGSFVIGVILVSFIPLVYEIIKSRREAKQEAKKNQQN